MSDVQLPDALAIKHLIATHMVATSTRGTSPAVTDLAEAISEVTLETQMAGSSLLTLTVIDPQWDLLTSGWLDVSEEGLLDEIEVNFPEGSDSWWRLCMIEPTGDTTGPNLTMTFQDRIISYLQEKWGPRVIAASATTRAQCIKALVDEVGRGDGHRPIKFVCPSINAVQPIAASTGTGTVTPAAAATKMAAKTNKSRGVGHGAAVTVKGATPTVAQIDLMNEVMGVADSLSAGTLASEALIEACIQENDFTNNRGGDGTSNGLLQFTAPTAASLGIDPLNVKQCVTAFLTRAYTARMAGTGSKGAIDYARKFPSSSPDEVAQAAQGSAFPHAYAQWEGEAKAIIAAYGGATLGSQISDTASPAAPVSDVSQLTRGTPDNPDESSWDCIQRLAAEVNWFAFSNGETLYYLEGPDLIAQRPSAYITRFPEAGGMRWMLVDGYTAAKSVDVLLSPTPSGRFDNTAFLYRSTHVRKGRIVRKSRLSKPQTASEIQLNLICDIDYLHAGDVIVFHGCGPLNGRWAIADTVRNCLADTFTQITLAPPQAPTPEPQATVAKANAATTVAASDPAITDPGKLAGVVQAAQKALAERAKYVYSEGADRGNRGTLFGPAPRTMDCSAFATLCYKAAGFSDPNHMGYNPIGFTGSFIAHCKKVANPPPGAVCFYGPSESDTKHMTVYIGNGQCISDGQQGDPVQLDAKYRADFLGYYVPDVASVGQSVGSAGGNVTGF
jgi:cell wall-associated NlpC family hydrolase